MTTSVARGDHQPVPYLTRGDVARLLGMDECIEAIEAAFAALGSGSAVPPSVLSHHVPGGPFHVKAASLRLSPH